MNHGAFILSADLSAPPPPRGLESRLSFLFHTLGLRPILLDRSLCDRDSVEILEAQTLVNDGWRSDFSDRAFKRLLGEARGGDVIVLSAEWHEPVMRGLDSTGFFNGGAAVVSLWPDWPAHTRFAVFPTKYHAGSAGRPLGDDADRTVCDPAYLFDLSVLNPTVHTVDESCDPLSLRFMDYLAVGVPVVAPRCAAWTELIEPGRTGALYDGEADMRGALELARRLSSKEVVSAGSKRFSVANAALCLGPYLARLRWLSGSLSGTRCRRGTS